MPLQFQHIPGTHLLWSIKRNELRVYDPTKPNDDLGAGEVGNRSRRLHGAGAGESAEGHRCALGLMRTLA